MSDGAKDDELRVKVAYHDLSDAVERVRQLYSLSDAELLRVVASCYSNMYCRKEDRRLDPAQLERQLFISAVRADNAD
jgi:hypothetical protein